MAFERVLECIPPADVPDTVPSDAADRRRALGHLFAAEKQLDQAVAKANEQTEGGIPSEKAEAKDQASLDGTARG